MQTTAVLALSATFYIYVLPASRRQMRDAGAGSRPIEVSPFRLLFGSRGIEGTSTSSAIDSEDTFAFSVIHKITPKIETVRVERAAQDYQRMLSHEVRIRKVIVTKN